MVDTVFVEESSNFLKFDINTIITGLLVFATFLGVWLSRKDTKRQIEKGSEDVNRQIKLTANGQWLNQFREATTNLIASFNAYDKLKRDLGDLKKQPESPSKQSEVSNKEHELTFKYEDLHRKLTSLRLLLKAQKEKVDPNPRQHLTESHDSHQKLYSWLSLTIRELYNPFHNNTSHSTIISENFVKITELCEKIIGEEQYSIDNPEYFL